MRIKRLKSDPINRKLYPIPISHLAYTNTRAPIDQLRGKNEKFYKNHNNDVS